MKNKTLVILAAGMGSRFGGLKQMTPFGPNGEFIIDYSIYDAIRCGFNRIVLVINRDNYDEFKETLGKRIQQYLNRNNVILTYCFQNLRNVPNSASIPMDRIKPLGTGHAVLCAKESINSPFLIINSDDFYGYQAFKDASEYLDKENKMPAIVGYNVMNTLTENGSVKRGICYVENNKLKKIIESTITKQDNKLIATPLSSNKQFEIPNNIKVSMNMIVFFPKIFDSLANRLTHFMHTANLSKDEFLLPDFITYLMEEEKEKIRVIDTTSVWAGVTYKEDTPSVINYINKLIENNVYPSNLWK